MNVYVFGLGHVGLPMACFAALAGKKVVGIDTDPKVVDQIRNGTINIYEYYNGTHISQLARELIKKNQLIVNIDFERTNRQPGVFLISIGIKSSEEFEQDLTPLQDLIKELLPKLVERDLLIFRTTLIPGTIDEIVVPQIKSLQIKVNLAYCPETISETWAFSELKTNPVIIAGLDDQSYEAAAAFFRSISPAPIYQAPDIKTAELVKVVQNISRDVNIALINELSAVAAALNINIDKVQSLANTHPRVDLLKPGPGVGGYCLPNAFVYLKLALANISQTELPLMSTARQCNIARPHQVVQVVEKILKENGVKIADACIAVAGLAMKDYCADCRYSPAIEIVKFLQIEGAVVKAFDPVVSHIYPFQVNSLEECLTGADCLVVTALQPGLNFDPVKIRALMRRPLVVDTRNTFNKVNMSEDAGDLEIYRI